MFPSPPPFSFLFNLLRVESSGSSRAPTQSKTPKETRQSQSYRTNSLTSREKTNAQRPADETMLRGGRLPHPRAWKLGRQRVEGTRQLKPEPRSIFQDSVGFKVGKN